MKLSGKIAGLVLLLSSLSAHQAKAEPIAQCSTSRAAACGSDGSACTVITGYCTQYVMINGYIAAKTTKTTSNDCTGGTALSCTSTTSTKTSSYSTTSFQSLYYR